jgi:hypothetical protein
MVYFLLDGGSAQMKINVKIAFFTIGIAIIIALISALILNASASFLESFINYLFYVSMPVTLIGVAMYVLRGGFFDFFSFSVKKVAKTLARNPEIDEQIRFDTNFKLSERINEHYMRTFLFSGFVLTIFSIAVAYAL